MSHHRPGLTLWETAREAYDRFCDLRTRSTAKTAAKREREAFLAAMLGTDLDANGYAIDPDSEDLMIVDPSLTGYKIRP